MSTPGNERLIIIEGFIGNGRSAKYSPAAEAEIAELLDDIRFGLSPKKAHECHTALTYLPQPFKLSEANIP